MRKALYILITVAVLTAGVCSADILTVVLNLGVTGDYQPGQDPSNGTGQLNWYGGQTASILTDTGPLGVTLVPNFKNTSFTGGTDTSSGGEASAYFTSGNWEVTLQDTSANDILTIKGNLKTNYIENEISAGQLNGGAVANVTDIIIHDANFFGGQSVTFDGGNTIGITAATTLLEDVQDYQTSWESSNIVVKLLADENNIPEPATMVLLGSGALLFLRKRK